MIDLVVEKVTHHGQGGYVQLSLDGDAEQIAEARITLDVSDPELLALLSVGAIVHLALTIEPGTGDVPFDGPTPIMPISDREDDDLEMDEDPDEGQFSGEEMIADGE